MVSKDVFKLSDPSLPGIEEFKELLSDFSRKKGESEKLLIEDFDFINYLKIFKNLKSINMFFLIF